MIQFYSPYIESELSLPESDSRHAVKVLRMKCGDELEVVDGRGHRYKCVLADDNPRHAAVEIVSCVEEPRPWAQEIAIIVAPAKHNDRMEWLVEKLTEIGVNRIIPVLCQRSERKEIKTERLEKIAVSAMKQSWKSYLPVIEPMQPLKQVIGSMEGYERFFGYCSWEVERLDFSKGYKPGVNTAIMIGPEGDFSPQEVQAAMEKGWKAVTFGPTRLRTETAALYGAAACHILDAVNR